MSQIHYKRSFLVPVLFLVVVVVLALMTTTCLATVRWHENGVKVSNAPRDQWYPTVVPDGSGGCIIAWEDDRDDALTDWDIYARAVDKDGHPQWQAGGVPLCRAGGNQYHPTAVSDGSGGAIVAWQDYRNEATSGIDIYAQRVDRNGQVKWAANGLPISTAAGNEQYAQIVTNGSSGAIITWQSSGNIFAQEIAADGKTKWTAGGVTVCDFPALCQRPKIAADGSSGAIITWMDSRSGDINIFAQRLDPDGTAKWASNGRAVSSVTSDKWYPEIAAAGDGGAIITWEDYRGGGCDVYAQRVSAGGSRKWVSGGVPVCNQPGEQELPHLATDGSGGAVIAWQDSRTAGMWNVFAQKLDRSGDKQWSREGLLLESHGEDDTVPRVVSDDAGGAIVTWRRQGAGFGVYSQWLDASGNPMWTPGGEAIRSNDDDLNIFAVCSDDMAGAIVAWEDYRDEPNRGAGIYAQRVSTVIPSVSTTFYFAEGTCRPGFDPYLCIQNPNVAEVEVKITYMLGDGTTQKQKVTVAATSRSTVPVKDTLGEGNDAAHDFSAKVESTGGDKIIVERPMYFNYQGYSQLNWPGGHDVIGATYPATTYYFAEGTCRPGFDPYLCIQNPNVAEVEVKITYMLGDGTTQKQKVTVAATSRSTVPVKDTLGEGNDAAHDFSAKVESTGGDKIIVERPMYFNYQGYSQLNWPGGHDVIGANP